MTKDHRWLLPFVLTSALALCGCAKKVDGQLAKADKLMNAGDYERAEVELLKVFDGTRSDLRVISRLGVLYQEQGKYKAAEFLDYAIQKNPNDVQARLALAQNRKEARAFGEALKHAVPVLEQDPGHLEAMLLVTEIAPPQEAKALLSLVDRAPPAAKQSAAFHVARANLLMRLQQMRDAKQELDQALKLDPSSPPALFAQANWQFHTRQTNAILGSLKAAAENAPLRSSYRILYARHCIMRADTNSALAQLREITTKAPDYVPAWSMLSLTHAALGDLPAALAASDKILRLDPGNLREQMWRGDLMLRANDPGAREYLERLAQAWTDRMGPRSQPTPSTNATAAATAPGGSTNQPAGDAPRQRQWSLPAELAINLAKANILEGRTNAALAYLNELLLSVPTNTAAILLRASLQVPGSLGDVALAVASLTELLEAEPNVPEARRLLATAYERQKKPDLAVLEINKLITRSPSDPTLRLDAGDIWLRAGDLKAARPYYQAALSLARTNFDAVMRLVSLDNREGKHDSAIAQAKQFCDQVSIADAWHLLYSAHVARINEARAKGNSLRAEDLAGAETALKKTFELRGEPRLQLDLAVFYFSTGQREKGFELLNRLEASSDPEFLMELARLQMQLKDWPAAARSFEKVVASQPTNAIALNDLAAIYTDTPDKLDRAAELARRATELAPRATAVGETLGWIYVKQGEAAKGVALIESAFRDPEVIRHEDLKIPISLHYGVALALLGEEDEAKSLLQHPSGADDKLIAATLAILNIDPLAVRAEQVPLIEQRLALFPKDVSALLRLANYQQNSGAAEKAAETYRRIDGLVRDNGVRSAALLSLAKLEAGPLGRKPEALKLAKQAHDLDPRNREAARVAGTLAWEAGDHKDAALLLEDASQGTRDPALWHQLAWAVYSVGRVNDAQTHLRRVMTTPAPPDLTNSAGRFLALVKAAAKGPDAVAALPLAESQLSTDAHHVPALMTKAVALEEQQKFPESEKLYKAILERWPSFAPAARGLALLYFEHLNNPQEALALGSRIRSEYPDDSRLARALGILAYRAEEFDRAVQFLNIVVAEHPEDAEATLYLAKSYSRIGQSARAKSYLQRVVADTSASEKLQQEAKAALDQIR